MKKNYCLKTFQHVFNKESRNEKKIVQGEKKKFDFAIIVVIFTHTAVESAGALNNKEVKTRLKKKIGFNYFHIKQQQLAI